MSIVQADGNRIMPITNRRELQLIALGGVPLVQKGDDLCQVIRTALSENNQSLRDNDILVIAQKIVSKAHGRFVDLRSVTASPRAQELAEIVGKDARLIELVLRESREVLRYRPGVIIVEHRLGFVMANAGIDASNVNPDKGENIVLLLPENPDAECARLRTLLSAEYSSNIGVVMNDSHGRAWRNGTVGVAIGASGVEALTDLRGKPDLFGRAQRITEVGHADEIAAAASLLMGQCDEALPMVIVRGLRAGDGRAHDLIRARDIDMFR